MANRRAPAVPKRINDDIAALKRRVSWLEAALKPKRSKPRGEVKNAQHKRDIAEMEARNKAMREYYEREREQRYRDNPNALRIALDLETRENEYLRGKGIKPGPSHIPASLRRKARSLLKR
jgi:hypothetical protein